MKGIIEKGGYVRTAYVSFLLFLIIFFAGSSTNRTSTSTIATTPSTVVTTVTSIISTQTPNVTSTDIKSSSSTKTINSETSTMTVTTQSETFSSSTILENKESSAAIVSYSNLLLPIFSILVITRIKSNKGLL